MGEDRTRRLGPDLCLARQHRYEERRMREAELGVTSLAVITRLYRQRPPSGDAAGHPTGGVQPTDIRHEEHAR